MDDSIFMLMILAAASDGKIEEIEMERIMNTAKCYPGMKGFKKGKEYKIARKCEQVMNNSITKEEGLGFICEKIDGDQKIAAFAYCFDIIAANFIIAEKEKDFMRLLKQLLNISDALAISFEESMKARFFSSGNNGFSPTFIS